MGETVVFFDNDHHRKLANYDVLRYDIIKKISFYIFTSSQVKKSSLREKMTIINDSWLFLTIVNFFDLY